MRVDVTDLSEYLCWAWQMFCSSDDRAVLAGSDWPESGPGTTTPPGTLSQLETRNGRGHSGPDQVSHQVKHCSLPSQLTTTNLQLTTINYSSFIFSFFPFNSLKELSRIFSINQILMNTVVNQREIIATLTLQCLEVRKEREGCCQFKM